MTTPDSMPPTTPEMPPPGEDVPTREPGEREVPDTPESPPPGEEDVPSDVEPGSDADIDRGGSEAEEPSPGDLQTERTGQMDDNIDDLGRKPDGTELDQPGAEGIQDDQE